MTDAELAARLRANIVAYKQFQSEHGGLRALALPGAWAFAMPEQAEQLHPQQVLYTDAGTLEAALPAIAGFYRGLGVRFWRVYVPAGDAAAQRMLSLSGYEPRDSLPAMGVPLEGLSLEAPRLTLERLETQQELISLNSAAFGPEVCIAPQPWHRQPYAPLRMLGVREGGQLVSGGMAFDVGDTAGIYLVATAHSVRGRGLASDVMRGLLLAAQARGMSAAVLQATPLGYGVYRRLGFRDLGAWVSWVHLAR